MHNLLVILIFTLRNFTKLPILRYLGICNVLHIWHIRAIPTSRVYRLYDTNYIKCVPSHQQVVDMTTKESKCEELPESKRYVTIIFDGMKEDIVQWRRKMILIGVHHTMYKLYNAITVIIRT